MVDDFDLCINFYRLNWLPSLYKSDFENILEITFVYIKFQIMKITEIQNHIGTEAYGAFKRQFFYRKIGNTA